MAQNDMKRTADPKDYPFSVSLESNEGKKSYLVVFNDFPNVIGGGTTIEDAVNEAYENLDVLFDTMIADGQTIPSPSAIDTSQLPSGKVTVRMSRTLHLALIKRAELEKMSLNSVINDAIAAYVYRPTFAGIPDGYLEEIVNKVATVCVKQVSAPQLSYENETFETKKNSYFPLRRAMANAR
jgi:predicted RNase H-like HicB family nuclease